MGFLSFFKTPKPQRFNYMPRYYDPQKERLDGLLGRNKDGEVSQTDLAKARISSAFRKRSVKSEYSKKMAKRSNLLLLAIIVILFALTYLLLTVYLPRFIHLFEGT
jgi:hypothetical protein